MRTVAAKIGFGMLAGAVTLLACLLPGVASSPTAHAGIQAGFEVDSIPPAPVTDLMVAGKSDTSVTLSWTAPGDDADTGTASTYDIRYSTSSITDANWVSATQCTGEPIPSASGLTETFTVTGLSVNTTYYFALKTADDASNWSTFSNIISSTATLNAPILSGGTVSPASGDTSANYTYSVIYTDFENEAPSSITITIDGSVSQNMTAKTGQDGDFTNSEIYGYTTTGANLGVGTHTFQFAASDGFDNAIGDIGSHSGPTVSSPPAPPAGGGGGGGGGATGVTNVYDIITPKGRLTQAVTAESDDGEVELFMAKNTIALDENGHPLRRIIMRAIEVPEEPPEPPADSRIIGLAYNFSPDGVTFDPPATLTFTYDPARIPDEATEDSLAIALWDEESGEWVNLVSTVDPETNTITAEISHFTVFTILPFTSAAAFAITDLVISPHEADVGEIVTISAVVVNSGDLSGSHRVTLRINDVVVAAQDVTLEGGASQQITFNTSADSDGIYSVDLDGLSGTIEFRPAIEPPKALAPQRESPKRASFYLADMTISPAEAVVGEAITIVATVVNNGEVKGAYTATLKINGNIEQTEQVILSPGDSQVLSFTVSRDKAGGYQVEISGQIGEFTLLPPPLTSSRSFLIAIIIVGVTVGVAIGFYRDRLMTRLRLRPILAMLNEVSDQDEREEQREQHVWKIDELEKRKKELDAQIEVSDQDEREEQSEYEIRSQDKQEHDEEYQVLLSDEWKNRKKELEVKIKELCEKHLKSDGG